MSRNDILFQTVRPYQQNNYLFCEDRKLPTVASTGYAVFRTQYDVQFLYALIHTKHFLSSVLSRCTGTSFPAVSASDIEDIIIWAPSVDEQQEIGELFRLLNVKIRKQKALVEALKKYKRGVMQHIFRQLPSRNGAEWTCVRLGDIFKKVSRRNTDGVIKNVITNSAEYGLIPQRDFFDKDIAVDGNTANYYVIENGDFVYNPRKSNSAPYGPFNRYALSEQGIISPLYTCLVLQADISPSYLAWYFKSDAWYRYIYDNGSQGVRHDRVSMTDDLLMGIPVMYPSHVKQLLYADILDMVEARLQATQKTLDFLNKMRDGYMRQLFI